MATIPSNSQIVFIAPEVDMTERKSSVNNATQTVYTMQDIADSASGPVVPAVFETGTGTESIQQVATGTTASGDYSVAIGVGATASAFYGIAIGQYVTASGYGPSIVLGDYATASGSYATSLNGVASGGRSFAVEGTASGYASLAMGLNSTASGYYSFAVSGGQATGGLSMATQTGSAQGHASIALGYASRAGNSDGGSPYGDGQIAIGTNSYAYGQFGMALGSNAFGNTTASGYGAIAIGGYSTASGSYSIAIQGTASGDNSVAINGGTASGYYSVAIQSGYGPCTAAGEQSFVIGNLCSTTALAPYSGVIGSGVANHQSAICIKANSNRDNAVFVNELSIMSIPTSAAGLPTGAVWRNGTVLNIVA